MYEDYNYSSAGFFLSRGRSPQSTPSSSTAYSGSGDTNSTAYSGSGDTNSTAYSGSGDTNSTAYSRGSKPSPPPYATVPRSHRFNPIGVSPPTKTSARPAANKRGNSKANNDDSDDPEEEDQYLGGVDSRREAVRRQRIELEQKRRDELRGAFARLKATLSPINQKSSKVMLLDRAASHIKYLEAQLKVADDEVNRLRNVNDALMLANQRHDAAAMATASVASSPALPQSLPDEGVLGNTLSVDSLIAGAGRGVGVGVGVGSGEGVDTGASRRASFKRRASQVLEKSGSEKLARIPSSGEDEDEDGAGGYAAEGQGGGEGGVEVFGELDGGSVVV
ncbi:hypothetical protein GYMLUDRAFT_164118 [Collybiopsis luxurians FD-317 M1]|uniref:BHLH domain-containing protein n=1 Tax=Collybiopsis luxurians FD-317 M1 TaxID=944289 RepID=A0A0D0D111_9AGAR|nr:hypothetical protein GYMLUDRAFT_164118 [Collybiopsis luxurians FD-317 M1]